MYVVKKYHEVQMRRDPRSGRQYDSRGYVMFGTEFDKKYKSVDDFKAIDHIVLVDIVAEDDIVSDTIASRISKNPNKFFACRTRNKIPTIITNNFDVTNYILITEMNADCLIKYLYIDQGMFFGNKQIYGAASVLFADSVDATMFKLLLG